MNVSAISSKFDLYFRFSIPDQIELTKNYIIETEQIQCGERKEKGEKVITYQKLKQVLSDFGKIYWLRLGRNKV